MKDRRIENADTQFMKRYILTAIGDFVENTLDYLEETQEKPLDFTEVYDFINEQYDYLEHRINVI